MTISQAVQLDVLLMEHPRDVSGLEALLRESVDAHDIVAVVGKIEGTGLGDDPDREAADEAIRAALAEHLDVPIGTVADRVCLVLSGGTPGVLSPHIAVVSVRRVETSDALDECGAGRLVVGTAHSAQIRPEDVGRLAHVDAVADAVRKALEDAGLTDPSDVHLVLVKAPSLSNASLADAARRGADTVTTDLGIGPTGAICYANDASALGVATALGEVDRSTLRDNDIRRDFSLFSAVAMTSSGGEKTHAEVLVFGNRRDAAGSLRIGHAPMRDIIDADAVARALTTAGLQPDPGTGEIDGDRIAYLFAKMIIPASDRLRGARITLADDPLGYHVAKAMGGYLLASTTGHTACFVSGGEHNSHQGPKDGNPLAAIVRVDQRP